jgi:hypothetical protein
MGNTLAEQLGINEPLGQESELVRPSQGPISQESPEDELFEDAQTFQFPGSPREYSSPKSRQVERRMLLNTSPTHRNPATRRKSLEEFDNAQVA